MAWTIGTPAKNGPQGLMQTQSVAFTTDSTTPTVITHGLGVTPDFFFVRSQTGGTHLAVITANGLGVTVTPSTAATTGVLVAVSYSQAG